MTCTCDNHRTCRECLGTHESINDELLRLREENMKLKLHNEVLSGESCKEERAMGNGGCGMCKYCCKELREQNEILKAALARTERERDYYQENSNVLSAEDSSRLVEDLKNGLGPEEIKKVIAHAKELRKKMMKGKS